MIFKQLEIRQFGKLRDFTLTPEPGLNRYTYPNEFGKTTLVCFLYFMLYGYEAKRLKAYFPWDGGPLSGSLTLETGGRDWRIERTRPEKGAGKRRVWCLSTGEELTLAAKEQPGPYFLQLDGETFLRTFCVTQSDVLFARTDGLDTALKNMAATGDENSSYQQAESYLNKQHTNYMHRGKTQGPLLDLQTELEQDRSALAVTEQTLNQKINEKNKWDRLRAELEQQDREIDGLNRRLGPARRSDALRQLRQLEALEQAGASRQQPTVPKEALAELERVFREQEEAEKAQTDAQAQKEEARARLQQAQETLSKQESLLREAEPPVRRARLFGIFAVICLIAGLLLLAAAALGAGWFFGVPGAAGLVLAGVFGVLALRGGQNRLASLQGELEVLRTQERSLRADFENADRRGEEAQAQSTASSARLRTLQEQYRVLTVQELEQLRVAWAVYEDDSARQQLHQQREALLAGRTREALEQAAAGGVLQEETAEQVYRLLNAVTMARTETAARLEALDVHSLESLWAEAERLREQIREKTERSARWQVQLEAVRLSLSWLKSANEEMNTYFAPKLCALAGENLAGMTDGRYRELLLDDGYEIRLRAAAGTYPAERFSAGTQSAVYFAFRLACGTLLGKEPLPLVLDDPFVHLDDSRRTQALALLERAAGERQILYFTCQS